MTDQQPEPQTAVTGGTHGAQAPSSKRQLLSKRQKSYALLVALLFLVLGVVGYRFATDKSLATLVDFSGAPERDMKKSVADWSKASKGDKFHEGDGARTPTDSEAHFRIGRGGRLRLKPASQIRFLRNHTGKKGTIGLQVEVGEADVRTDEGMLSLDSEFGPILIEANSAVTLRREGPNMVLNVDLGTIEIGEGRRSLQAGQSVELEMGGIEVVEQTKAQPEPEPTNSPEDSAQPLDFGDGVNKYDLVVGAGATFVVHDPQPPTKIGFRIGTMCDGPTRLTSGKLNTEAAGTLGLPFEQGRHTYEVRCLEAPDKVVAKGAVSVLRDSGTRTLPAFTPSASVATDGRKYTVLYQQRLPRVTVTWPSAPEASSYTLTAGGRTISTSSPSHTFQALAAGTHQVVFSANTDPPRKSRSTTVHVVYDTQAPAARVSNPPSGYVAGSSVTVAGQALPGWKVSVDGKELQMDSQLRFSSPISAGSSLPIAFSHPTHGMHYYLRRSASQ